MKVMVEACKCEICGDVWLSQIENPARCGRCKSLLWDKSRKKAEAIQRAEERNDHIRKFLADSDKMGAIYGTLLGDATITYIEPGRYQYKKDRLKCGKDGTCYVRIRHAADQKALVEHKHDFMKEIAGEISVAKPKNPAWQSMHLFYTKTSPLWQPIYRELYTGAREVVGKTGHVQRFKRVTREILEKVSDRGLAWWVMDDGCYSFDNGGYGFFRLSTQGYTYEENELIVGWLKDRYGVESSIQKNHRKGIRLATYDSHVLYIGCEEFEKLKQRIEPHIIPTLRTKLGQSSAIETVA